MSKLAESIVCQLVLTVPLDTMKHANVDQADIPLPRTKVGLLLPLSSTNEDEESYTPLANYRLKSDPVVNDPVGAGSIFQLLHPSSQYPIDFLRGEKAVRCPSGMRIGDIS